MAKYVAMYICPICGSNMVPGAQTELPEDKLPELLAMVVKQQRFAGTSLYQIPMHIPHRCADGSAGLACFAGFKKIG